MRLGSLCGKLRLAALVMGGALFSMNAALAAQGGYLAGYENVDPRPAAISWWSTIAYMVTLLAVFAVVAVLAYWVSRFLGGHFARASAADGGRILSHLPLGPGRSVCVVELANRVYVLGVTDHSVNLLREITEEAEIEKIHREALGRSGTDGALSGQLGSLQSLAERIPSIFKGGAYRR